MDLSDRPDLSDERFMAEALAVGAAHVGFTGANPSVGCLIVRDDGAGPEVVAAAVTAPGGRPHAETQALEDAGEAARGATAYVTLEPCSHHGHTPPCAEALIKAGIARVVVSVIDPDTRVSGRGVAMLRDAGVTVETGMLAEDGQKALEGYLMRKRHGRPHVTLKLAVSQDGMIGATDRAKGEGQIRITQEESRTLVQHIRVRSDAILVGIGTALADDPELTVRLPGLEHRSPVRIVLDAGLRLPPQGKLAASAHRVPLIVVTRDLADEQHAARAEVLKEQGVEVLACDPYRIDLLLPALASRGLSSLLVEGGASTAASFLASGFVDRVMLFTGAPTIGALGIAAPFTTGLVPAGFMHTSSQAFGPDRLDIYERTS